MKELLLKIINVSIEAGKEICKIYKTDDFGVSIKDDNSPLTKADKAANAKIMTVLTTLDFPIISEENKLLEYSERKDWNKFWLVDPLDGTKEFIKKNGQFTVNIALIENNVPILGVIYVPAQKELFFGVQNIGSFKILDIESDIENYDELMTQSQKLPVLNDKNSYKVIASKSHFSDETKAFVDSLKNEHKNLELINVGSSLKFCTIAEGKADVYPRFGPTMEWDIAAGSSKPM